MLRGNFAFCSSFDTSSKTRDIVYMGEGPTSVFSDGALNSPNTLQEVWVAQFNRHLVLF